MILDLMGLHGDA